jgi:hypothetical protein
MSCSQTQVNISKSVRLVDVPGKMPQFCYQMNNQMAACEDAFTMKNGQPIANLGMIRNMNKEVQQGSVYCKPAGSGSEAGLLCYQTMQQCQQTY